MSRKSLKLIVVVIALVCSGEIAQASSISSPLTLEYLLNTPIADLKSQLGKFDIAEVNLACAEGLAGSEDLDKKARLETLDKWTQHIRRETERCLPQFYQDKGYYYGSLNYYKILMLVTVLHQDFGVGYNMDLVNSGILYDFTTTKFNASSKDVFVHGLLADKRTGSCASMPVLVVAIGRRLGYPLKLVGSKGHLFARWDSSTERFNIEASGRGLNVHPDSHYRQWPVPMTKEEEQNYGYLKSLSPVAELVGFIYTRAMCLIEHKRYGEAIALLEKIERLQPNSVGSHQELVHVKQKYGSPAVRK